MRIVFSLLIVFSFASGIWQAGTFFLLLLLLYIDHDFKEREEELKHRINCMEAHLQRLSVQVDSHIKAVQSQGVRS